MSDKLVVVESPTKAKTLSKFLGSDYDVVACLGHVRALPSKPGSVDIENDFTPKYQVLPRSRKYLNQIRSALPTCRQLILATDLDREGEAIAWHLLAALKLNDLSPKGSPPPEVRRIIFHEITREAIEEALKSPRNVAVELVNAQQARVVLDYLFGFNLSPLLWRKVRSGLSAGRVQSVALRVVCEREKEIRSFTAKEYWSIHGTFSVPAEGANEETFTADLVEFDGAKLKKLDIQREDQARAIAVRLEGLSYTVREIRQRDLKRNPPPPFTTSTLQQEASRKLGFTAKKTMSVAQKLYEGVEMGSRGMTGLITYMRTDSVHLAASALEQIKGTIIERFGRDYALERPRQFKQKSKNVQEAHEAIRPTEPSLSPEESKPHLTRDQLRLYDLIWKRTLAGQMAQAIIESLSVDIGANGTGLFRATGSRVKFMGFMKIYVEGKDAEKEGERQDDERQRWLPPLSQGQTLGLEKVLPEQHFTQPPPRYTEATLVKTLEEYGIGRPSTYATIISILQMRNYVHLVNKQFHPEDVGLIVSDLLVTHFPRYVDYQFTAQMEEDLDGIARGEKEWKPVVRNFWDPFLKLLKEKEGEIRKSDVVSEKTEEMCPECSKPLVIRLGRYSRFYACTGYPKCRYVRPLQEKKGDDGAPEEKVTESCEKCGRPMVMKEGRYGRFLACSGYPSCKNIKSSGKATSLGMACPECEKGDMLEKRTRRGKTFYGCSRYPDCQFATWSKPVEGVCPECGSLYLIEKASKRFGLVHKCPNKQCNYRKEVGKQDAENEQAQ